MPSTGVGRPAVAGVEPSVVRSDGEAGVTIVLGASPVAELFFALCAHARLVEFDAAQLPWHHAFANALDDRGSALFQHFFGGFDRGLLLSDLFVTGPHRDLERFPAWVESLTDAQILRQLREEQPRTVRLELIPSCYIGARWANVFGPRHMVCAFQVRPPGWSVDDTLTLELVRRRAEALAEPSRLSLLRMVASGEA